MLRVRKCSRSNDETLSAEGDTAGKVLGGDRSTECAFNADHDAWADVEIKRLRLDRSTAFAVMDGRVGVTANMHSGGQR